MADLITRHPQYRLLANNHRRKCALDSTTITILCIITIPMVVFCAIYMLLFGVYEKVVYPKFYNIINVPNLWLSRAETYNQYSLNELNNLGNSTIINFKSHHYTTIDNNSNSGDFKLVCYYTFPSDNINELYTKNLDAFLCTHIIVGFGSVVNNSVSLTDREMDVLQSVVQLKKYNLNLKVMVSVGGAGNVNGFPEMVLNHANRKQFIKSVVNLVRKYDVDGVDLDWEFPNEQTSADKNQRMHFTQLLEEFRININKQDKHKFLLSVAVPAPVFMVDNFYDVSYINQYVDFINLMSYDYHFYTTFTPFTGLNAPLYAASGDKGYFATLNINYSTNYWNIKGMDKTKIIVGLPTYGHSFRLTNTNNNGLGAPSSGYGKLGSKGFANYDQVCNFLFANQISPMFEMDSKSPYATKSHEWISFEDEQSLSYKAEFIRDNNYGGAMVLSLNTDDHRGLCKLTNKIDAETFPLTKTVRNILSSEIVS